MRSVLDHRPRFSQAESNPPVLELVDLNRSVATAVSNLAVLIEERGAQVSVGVLPEIQGDDAQMMQLFQNLITNAIKFCHLRTPKIEVKAFKDAGRNYIQVSDNGIGIEPANYQRIFRIFRKRDAREEFLGTGAGLTVCQHIMENHGGRIEVESLVGQGSTFTLRF